MLSATESKVAQLGDAISSQQHVVGGQVAMDHRRRQRMQESHGTRYGFGDPNACLQIHGRWLSAKLLGHRAGLAVLGNERHLPIDACEDAHDVAMSAQFVQQSALVGKVGSKARDCGGI